MSFTARRLSKTANPGFPSTGFSLEILATVKSLRETLIHERNPIHRSEDADEERRKEDLFNRHQPAIASGELVESERKINFR